MNDPTIFLFTEAYLSHSCFCQLTQLSSSPCCLRSETQTERADWTGQGPSSGIGLQSHAEPGNHRLLTQLPFLCSHFSSQSKSHDGARCQWVRKYSSSAGADLIGRSVRGAERIPDLKIPIYPVCLDVLYLASLWRQFIKSQEERCRRGDGCSQEPHAWSEELEAGLVPFLRRRPMGPTQGWAESECWASEGHLRGVEAWASEEAGLFLSALCTTARYRSAFPLPVSYPLPFFQTVCPPVGFTGRW